MCQIQRFLTANNPFALVLHLCYVLYEHHKHYYEHYKLSELVSFKTENKLITAKTFECILSITVSSTFRRSHRLLFQRHSFTRPCQNYSQLSQQAEN